MSTFEVAPDPKPVVGSRPGRAKAMRRATAAQWRQLHWQKQGPCRLCDNPEPNELHHLISRARGGKDVADNLVPLCRPCHECITQNRRPWLEHLAAALTDSEYAYLLDQLGEYALERLYGV